MMLLGALILLVPLVQASVLTLQSPRFTITSTNASQARAEPISLVKKTSPPLSLGPTDTLKITFQVIEKDTGNGVQPHQTFLRFYDEVSQEEGIQPLRVNSAGKAKFELNMAKPPLSLPPTSKDPLKVTLIVGSHVHSPLKVELFDLYVPASHPPPQHPDEASFHPLPVIQHTFRPDQKLPPTTISAAFSALVLAPWVVLLGLWAKISPRVPRLFSPSIVPFVATLTAFEVLLFWYWIELKLGQVLLYGAILAIPTVLAGQQALVSIGQQRLRQK